MILQIFATLDQDLYNIVFLDVKAKLYRILFIS